MDNNKTSIIFFGSGDFPYPTFKTIVENEVYDVKGLVTSPYKPYFYSETLKDVAERNNIPVFSTHKPNCAELVEWLKEKETDIFCVISYKFLSNDILRIPKITAFNVHASLLPLLRGAAPINWAIRYGFKNTGLTSFVLNEHIDCGEIINNISIPIESNDDYGVVFNRLSVLNVGFTIETISRLRKSDWRRYLILQPDHIEDDMFMNAPKLNNDNCTLNTHIFSAFNYTIPQLYDVIRSLSPNIGLNITLRAMNEERNGFCCLKKYDAKIYKAKLFPEIPEEHKSYCKSYSNVVTDGKSFMYLVNNLNTQIISIEEIQLAGKKKLNIKDFVAGFQWARDKNVYLLITGR